jgi:hypothetical protein
MNGAPIRIPTSGSACSQITRRPNHLHRRLRQARPAHRLLLHRRLPPAPPPPPQIPDFIFTSGPGQQIGVYYADGRRMTRIPPGTYTIQVHDLSTTHDFHLTGPGGVDRRTDVGEIEHPIWTVTFRAGTYTFKCDVHASMKGTFVPRV